MLLSLFSIFSDQIFSSLGKSDCKKFHMEISKLKWIRGHCFYLDTFVPYDWTEADNATQGEWTGYVGADGHGRSEDTEKAYCENQLKLKRDKNGKLINEGKVFVFKGPAGKDSQFPGCLKRWCCQKKTRKHH